jgi:hypothetical protein
MFKHFPFSKPPKQKSRPKQTKLAKVGKTCRFWHDLIGCEHRLKEAVPMPNQPVIPGLCDAVKKKITRLERFRVEFGECTLI